VKALEYQILSRDMRELGEVEGDDKHVYLRLSKENWASQTGPKKALIASIGFADLDNHCHGVS